MIFSADICLIMDYSAAKNLGMGILFDMSYTPKTAVKIQKIAFFAILNQNFCAKSATEMNKFFGGHLSYHGLLCHKKFGDGDVV